MKKHLLITCAVALCAHCFSQTTVNSSITEETTWTKSGSPYTLTDDVTVTAHLTIEPGVTVKMSSGRSLYIAGGGLEVKGAAGDSVVFTSSEESTGNSYWGSICITDTMTRSTVAYAKIENATYGLYVIGASVAISHVRARNCHVGFEITNDSVNCQVDSCTLEANDYGIDCYNSLYATNNHHVIVQNSLLAGNGCGVYSNMNAEILGNVIRGNEQGVWTSGGNVSISNNDINGNNIGVQVKYYASRTTITCNNFSQNTGYHLNAANAYDYVDDIIDATNNYFGTTDTNAIRELIHDWNDDTDLSATFTISPVLSTYDPVAFTQQPEGQKVCLHSPFILSAQQNYQDASFLWFKDGVSLEGDTSYSGVTSSTLVVGAATAAHAGVYTCEASTTCKTASSDTAIIEVKQPYTLDTLCLATVSDNGKNVLLVWERTGGKGTVKYNIYREGFTDEYDKLGELPFEKPGIFVDSTASVDIRAYRYKLTTTDECGNELPVASTVSHKTIHLMSSLVDNKLQLDWSLYVGAQIRGYCLLSGTSYDAMDTIDKFGSDQISYQISNPGNNVYRVVSIFAKTFYPGQEKSDNGPYSQSLSNMAESELLGNRPVTPGIELALYPNPAQGSFTCFVLKPSSNSSLLQVIDATGKVVLEKHLAPSNSMEEKITLAPGMYTVRLTTGNSARTGRILVY